jgi:beta-N-acetylhexosaminidase
VILRFSGTEPPAYVERALRKGWAGGVILFADNISTPAALRSMTRRLQRAAGGDALISTDQEGGPVRRIPFAGPVPGQAALGTPDGAREAARAGAKDLDAFGINLNLGPVADVAASPGSMARSRAFPGETVAVAISTKAAVRGYRGAGVAPTLKHFPGLGAATANTDDEPVTIWRPARELGAMDLPPFKAGIEAGAPAVMASHALYPALDGRDIASQSRPILTGLLRNEMGFRGVIVTDALEAAAARARGTPEESAVRSVRAGADLLLTTRRGSHLRVLRAVIAEARRSRAFRERLDESARRVQDLRRTLAPSRAG